MAALENLTYQIILYKDNAKVARVPCNFLAPEPLVLSFDAPMSSSMPFEYYQETKQYYTHYAIEMNGRVLYKQEI